MVDIGKVINELVEHIESALAVDSDYVDCVRTDLLQTVVRLLKEQEAIVPYIDIDEAKCPICKVKLTRQELLGDDVLFEDFFDYCPHCGRSVKWE